jgi:hypothetical protein
MTTKLQISEIEVRMVACNTDIVLLLGYGQIDDRCVAYRSRTHPSHRGGRAGLRVEPELPIRNGNGGRCGIRSGESRRRIRPDIGIA